MNQMFIENWANIHNITMPEFKVSISLIVEATDEDNAIIVAEKALENVGEGNGVTSLPTVDTVEELDEDEEEEDTENTGEENDDKEKDVDDDDGEVAPIS